MKDKNEALASSSRELGNIWNKYRAVLIMIAFAIVASFLSEKFMTLKNIMNILNQSSINAILALGLTTVILTGGIDISVGSTLAFSGAIAAFMLPEYGIVPALAAAIAVGVIIGAMNGLLISRWNLQPMIVTLATMSIFRGATYLLTGGKPITVNDESFKLLGSGKIGSTVVAPIVIMLILVVIMQYLLNLTPFGRHIYSVGGNEEAAFLSGVNTKRTKLTAYIISGVLAAIAGIVITARLSSAQPTAGNAYEMDAIAAAVIGGTSLKGGQGKIAFSIVGALLIGMLYNSLTLMDVSTYYQTVIKGVVIVIAVLIDAKSK